MMIYIVHKVHLYDNIHHRFKDDRMMIYNTNEEDGLVIRF
jgi:hypothetical protein